MTLAAIHRHAVDRKRTGAVLYLHTHGAWSSNEAHHEMRQRVTEALVLQWRECARRLAEGADAVGVGFRAQMFYPANCWMASCDHLRRLQRPNVSYDAMSQRAWNEHWLTHGGHLADMVIAAAPARECVEPLSRYEDLEGFVRRCLWNERPSTAAADRFLLEQLADLLWWRQGNSPVHPRTPQVAQSGRMTLADLPTSDVLEIVEEVGAAWPGWKLTGEPDAPILKRLDLHFLPVQEARIRWRGHIPVAPDTPAPERAHA